MINKELIRKHLRVLRIPNDVDFTIEDVNSAYRHFAKMYHPDKNKSVNAQAKIIEINEAKEWIVKNFSEIKKVDFGKVDNRKNYKITEQGISNLNERRKYVVSPLASKIVVGLLVFTTIVTILISIVIAIIDFFN